MRRGLLLLVLPLALAACGGGSTGSALKIDPAAYVRHSAIRTADAPSEHMTITGKVSGDGVSISMTGSGDYATTTKRASASIDFSGAGQSGTMNEVLDGATIYMSSPLFSNSLPGGKKWVKLNLQEALAAKGINTSSLMSQSPKQSMQNLEAGGTVTTVGTETIDGAETTHFRVTNIDISKLPQGRKLEAIGHYKYGPIDVWVDNGDGYVRRESLSYSYSVDGQSATIAMTMGLSDFGEAVHVTVPPASETVDMTKQAIKGLGG